MLVHRTAVQHVLAKLCSVVRLVLLINDVRHPLFIEELFHVALEDRLHRVCLIILLEGYCVSRTEVAIDLCMQEILKEIVLVVNFERLRDAALVVVEKVVES